MAKSPFPFYFQMDSMDCGATCLRIVAAFFGKQYPAEYLRTISHVTKNGISMADISEAAEQIGFNTMPIAIDFEALVKDVPLPCIAHWEQKHFVVVYKVTKHKIYIADPAKGKVSYSFEDFKKYWSANSEHSNPVGHVLLIETTPQFYESETPHKEDKQNSLFFFLNYIKPYKRYILQLFLGLIAGSLIQLVFPFLTQSIVDYGIQYQDFNFIYLILIAQLTLFASQLTVDIIRNWILLHLSTRISIRLISDFLLKLTQLPISFFDSKKRGDIIQRIFDHNRIEDFLSNTSLNTLFSIVNIAIFGIVLAYYNLTIFSVFFIGSLLYFLWNFLFIKKRILIDKERFQEESKNTNAVFQIINAMQEIKLNGSDKRRRWEWQEIQVNLFGVLKKGLKLSNTQNIGGYFFNELKNILITFLAAKAVIDGEITLGMMLSIQYIIGQLNSPIQNIIVFVQTGLDAKLSLERLMEIHDKANEELDPTLTNNLPEEKSISIQNLSFRYGGKHSPLVLNDISFAIPQGKITAIVGESGSGKTTLIKLLLKFYSITEGTILVGNQNISNIPSTLWRASCGTVMQDGFIFNDTIERNITESASLKPVDQKQLAEAMRIANIQQFVSTLPNGIQTKIGSNGLNLSGGQTQRLLIARAVYKNPNFLFFDEATSSLDAVNESEIISNLTSFYKGKTVVIVAHRLSTVRNADNIVVLQQGKITEQGTHNSLVAKKGFYFELVRNQLNLSN